MMNNDGGDVPMDEDFNNDNEGNNNPSSKKMKVIIPPPEIKTIIDRTADYVARNGASFESLIMKVEERNPKFNFLRFPDDPYRPYYIQKIHEHQGELSSTNNAAATAPSTTAVNSL